MLVNFLVWQQGFEEFLKILNEENKEIYGYEEEIKEKAPYWLDKINCIDVQEIPLEVFEEIRNNYKGLDDGEVFILSFLRIKRKEGRNCCFISDDYAARKAAEAEKFLPCCVKNCKVGGTLGILNLLYKYCRYTKSEIDKYFDNMKKQGNFLPENWIKDLDNC